MLLMELALYVIADILLILMVCAFQTIAQLVAQIVLVQLFALLAQVFTTICKTIHARNAQIFQNVKHVLPAVLIHVLHVLMDIGLKKALVNIAHHGAKNVLLIPCVLNYITSLEKSLFTLIKPPTCQQLVILDAFTVPPSTPCSVSFAMMDSS